MSSSGNSRIKLKSGSTDCINAISNQINPAASISMSACMDSLATSGTRKKKTQNCGRFKLDLKDIKSISKFLEVINNLKL
jgi:hypothetical protein